MRNYQPPPEPFWIAFIVLSILILIVRIRTPKKKTAIDLLEEKRTKKPITGIELPTIVKEAIEKDKKNPAKKANEKPVTTGWIELEDGTIEYTK